MRIEGTELGIPTRRRAIGPALAATLEFEQTLSKIAEVAVRELADYCIVDLVEEGEVLRWKALARDPAKQSLAESLARLPLDRKRPHLTGSVLETKQPLLVERVTAEIIDAWARSEAHRRALRALDARSVVAVPLLAEGRLLGALALISSTRAYDSADLQLAEELAHRAALSLENARLYRLANRAIQVRDEVMGIVVHDLRNPLSSIVMSASLLRRRAAQDDSRARNTADAIDRAARRMDRLIQDLFDVMRMEAGPLSLAQGRVRIHQLISDALEVQEPLAAAASLELHADVAPALPEVSADRDRLLQVFGNLIGNALKFTKPGGCISVGAAPRGSDLLFWVADTGPGIAAGDLPRLFDRFWHVGKHGRGGVGLGLPIVRGIVEAHGGSVWVESTQGRGSTFYFTIPTKPQAERTS